MGCQSSDTKIKLADNVWESPCSFRLLSPFCAPEINAYKLSYYVVVLPRFAYLALSTRSSLYQKNNEN